MKIFNNISLTIVLVAALSACAQVTLIKPGIVTIDDTLTVTAQNAWNKFPISDGMEIWTFDGPDLQALSFNTQIKEGENIFRQVSSVGQTTATFDNIPKFRKGMTPIEISEMYVASYQQIGLTGVKVTGIRSEEFAGRTGFYFELEYTDKEGLERQGIVHGTVQDGVMHLITYTAPKIHYFKRDRALADRIIKSARFLSPAGA